VLCYFLSGSFHACHAPCPPTGLHLQWHFGATSDKCPPLEQPLGGGGVCAGVPLLGWGAGPSLLLRRFCFAPETPPTKVLFRPRAPCWGASPVHLVAGPAPPPPPSPLPLAVGASSSNGVAKTLSCGKTMGDHSSLHHEPVSYTARALITFIDTFANTLRDVDHSPTRAFAQTHFQIRVACSQ